VKASDFIKGIAHAAGVESFDRTQTNLASTRAPA